MKKILLTALAAVLLLASCGGSEGKGAENISSTKDAGQIIAYTNELIDKLNLSSSWVRSNQGALRDLQSLMRNKRGKGHILPLNNSGITMASVKAANNKAAAMPSGFSAAESEFFKGNATGFEESFTALRATAGDLYTYLKNEDYKDDDYAKGIAMADSIDAQHTRMSEYKELLFDKIDVVTEAAELVILEESPLKDPILALKAEMKNLEGLFDVYSQYDEKELTADAVVAAYDAASASIEKNKVANKDVLDANGKTSAYDRFYSQCDKTLATYRKALRKVKENKKLTDNDFKDMRYQLNFMVSNYNDFVK